MSYPSGSILAVLREHAGAENPSTTAPPTGLAALDQVRIEKFALIGAN